MDPELKKFCLDLMASAGDVCVACVDEDGLPQIRVMFNLRNRASFPALVPFFEKHEDDFLVTLATNTSSPKVRQLRARPEIAVLYSDNPKFHSLMVSGRAEFVDDIGIKKALWQNGWEIFYPGGPSDPDYTVVRLRPVKAKGWRGDNPYSFSLPAGR